MRPGAGRTRFVEFSSACSFHNFPKRFRVSSNSPCRDPDTDPTTMRSRAHQEPRQFPLLSNCCLVHLNGYDRRGLKGLRKKGTGERATHALPDCPTWLSPGLIYYSVRTSTCRAIAMRTIRGLSKAMWKNLEAPKCQQFSTSKEVTPADSYISRATIGECNADVNYLFVP